MKGNDMRGLGYGIGLILLISFVSGCTALDERPGWRDTNARTGAVSEAGDEPAASVEWVYRGDFQFAARPVPVADKLFCALCYSSEFNPEERQRGGRVVCLDQRTGEVQWSSPPGEPISTTCAPAVSGNCLLVAESCRNGRVFCFDISPSDPRPVGVKRWMFETRGRVFDAPVVADDKVYISSAGDSIYCLPLNADSNGEIRPLWQLSSAQYPDCRVSPLISGNRAYVGLGLNGNAVCCLDIETGRELWRVHTPAPVICQSALAQGKLFFSTGYADMVGDWREAGRQLDEILSELEIDEKQRQAMLAGVHPKGEVWCLDVATRKVEWRFETAEAVVGAIVVDGRRLYFGSRDGEFYCLTTSGDVVAKRSFADPVIAPPAVGPDCVYLEVAGQLYALRKNDLTPLWQVTVDEQETLSPPVLAEGVVYAGTSHSVIAVGKP